MTGKRKPTLLRDLEPPADLFSAVLLRVAYARRRAAFFRLAARGSVIVASAMVAVPVLRYASAEFYASGFFSYLSLVFSDVPAATQYWRELSLSLIESLPSLAILMVIAIGLALFWALRRIARDAREVRTLMRLTA